MRGGVSKKLKNITVGALLAALSVAIIALGGVIEVLDLSAAAIASFICVFAVIELGGVYPWLIFAVSSTLSLILIPSNFGAWCYLLFFGYYAILKEKIERLNNVLAWVLKMLIGNIAFAILLFGFGTITYGAGLSFTELVNKVFETNFGTAMIIGVILIVEATFVMYDIALTRIITFYFKKLRHRFKFLHK